MLTLNELKYWLAVKPAKTSPEQNELDEFLQGLIDDAVDTAETICGQKLAYGLDTFTVDLRNRDPLLFRMDDSCNKEIFISPPVDIITKIQYLSTSGVLTDIIPTNPNGISSGIYTDKKVGILKLLDNYRFHNSINVIEYYHGYKDTGVFKVPKTLKKCIKYLATIEFNNSNVRDSRFGLTSKNMNAAGSSGLSFRSDKDLMDNISKELQPYKLIGTMEQ